VNQSQINSKKTISVLGAGSWGTALASLLSSNAHDVYLWGRNNEHIASLNKSHVNDKYLPDIILNKNLKFTSDFDFAVSKSDFIVLATPSNTLEIILNKIKAILDINKLSKKLILTSKGFNKTTGAFLTDSIDSIFSSTFDYNIEYGVISGPSFAIDLAQGLPTSVVMAAKNQNLAKNLALLFHNNNFRVYDGNDIYGVQLGGDVKNIIAFMAGIADGLKLGSNSYAALITRGLNEIMRLGEALHVNPKTLIGLSGLGDLVLTAGDNKSRNRRFGLYMAEGNSVDQAIKAVGQTVESQFAVKYAYKYAKKYNLDLPITTQAYNILYNNLPIKEAIKNLLDREQKSEF
tara:strand:- start:13524 stop:14564 length:1041 start_codon:yes stop_codon:yes gene_type:complete